jgi:hypothetical protein
MLAGYVSGGWQMARAALVASAALAAGSSDDDFYRGKITTAQFFAEHFLPRATAHLATIKAGADTVMALDVDMF